MPVQGKKFAEDTGWILEDKRQKEKTGRFTNKIRKTRCNDQGHESGRRKHVRIEENVDKLAGVLGLSQEGQRQTTR